MIKLTEWFYSIQGEIDVGKPAIFIRTNGCSMQPKCKFCDSKYSWNNGKNYTIKQLYDEIKDDLKKCKFIVFTGGEPMLQIKEIIKFMDYVSQNIRDEVEFGIETNGLHFSNELQYFDYISVSPKKQNFKIDTLRKFNKSRIEKELNVRFKFVYETNNLWFENIIKKLNLDKNIVYIMPEGQTKKEQNNKMIKVIEYCKEKGYNFAVRLHILIWNKRRKV